MVYLPTCTIKVRQMWVNISYLDIYGHRFSGDEIHRKKTKQKKHIYSISESRTVRLRETCSPCLLILEILELCFPWFDKLGIPWNRGFSFLPFLNVSFIRFCTPPPQTNKHDTTNDQTIKPLHQNSSPPNSPGTCPGPHWRIKAP